MWSLSSLLSWSLPLALEQRFARFILRKVICPFLIEPELLDEQAIAFEGDRMVLGPLRFHPPAVNGWLPLSLPEVASVTVKRLEIELPWNDILAGMVRVHIEGVFVTLAHTHGNEALPPDDHADERTDTGEYLDASHSSMLDGLVASFGRALIQRIYVTVGGVRVALPRENDEIVLSVSEVAFNGPEDWAWCTCIYVAVVSDDAIYTTPRANDLSVDGGPKEAAPERPSNDPPVGETDVRPLRIRQVITLDGTLSARISHDSAMCIHIRVPQVSVEILPADLALTDALKQLVQPGNADNGSMLFQPIQVDASLEALHVLVAYDTDAAGSHILASLDQVHMNAYFTGEALAEVNASAQILAVHDCVRGKAPSPVVLVRGTEAAKIPLDDSAAPSAAVFADHWHGVPFFTPTRTHAVCLTQQTGKFHLHFAEAHVFFDVTLCARIVPLWHAFEYAGWIGQSNSSTVLLWRFLHGLLELVPTVSIACPQGKMALNVPFMRDKGTAPQPSRSGVWTVEARNIHTLNTVTQDDSVDVQKIHAAVDDMAVSHWAEGTPYTILDMRGADNAPVSASLAFTPTGPVDLTAHLDLNAHCTAVALHADAVAALYRAVADIGLFFGLLMPKRLATVRMNMCSDAAPDVELSDGNIPMLWSCAAGMALTLSLDTLTLQLAADKAQASAALSTVQFTWDADTPKLDLSVVNVRLMEQGLVCIERRSDGNAPMLTMHVLPSLAAAASSLYVHFHDWAVAPVSCTDGSTYADLFAAPKDTCTCAELDMAWHMECDVTASQWTHAAHGSRLTGAVDRLFAKLTWAQQCRTTLDVRQLHASWYENDALMAVGSVDGVIRYAPDGACVVEPRITIWCVPETIGVLLRWCALRRSTGTCMHDTAQADLQAETRNTHQNVPVGHLRSADITGGVVEIRLCDKLSGSNATHWDGHWCLLMVLSGCFLAKAADCGRQTVLYVDRVQVRHRAKAKPILELVPDAPNKTALQGSLKEPDASFSRVSLLLRCAPWVLVLDQATIGTCEALVHRIRVTEPRRPWHVDLSMEPLLLTAKYHPDGCATFPLTLLNVLRVCVFNDVRMTLRGTTLRDVQGWTDLGQGLCDAWIQDVRISGFAPSKAKHVWLASDKCVVKLVLLHEDHVTCEPRWLPGTHVELRHGPCLGAAAVPRGGVVFQPLKTSVPTWTLCAMAGPRDHAALSVVPYAAIRHETS